MWRVGRPPYQPIRTKELERSIFQGEASVYLKERKPGTKRGEARRSWALGGLAGTSSRLPGAGSGLVCGGCPSAPLPRCLLPEGSASVVSTRGGLGSAADSGHPAFSFRLLRQARSAAGAWGRVSPPPVIPRLPPSTQVTRSPPAAKHKASPPAAGRVPSLCREPSPRPGGSHSVKAQPAGGACARCVWPVRSGASSLTPATLWL